MFQFYKIETFVFDWTFMDSYNKCAGQLLDLFLNVQEKPSEPVFLRAATPAELLYFAKAGIVPIKVPAMKKPFIEELLNRFK